VLGGEGTQYVCTGWAMEGQVDTNGLTAGAGTNVTLTITNDAVLTWLWQTNYWLDVGSQENGWVVGTQGWCTAGSVADLEAVPSNYYHFLAWTGTVTTSTNPLSLSLCCPQAVVATFGENLATNNTPQWWLAAHGLTNDDWDVLALADSDDDGMRNWQEWVAGTDPTNHQSLLSISQVVFTANGRLPLSFASVTGRTYQVWQSLSMTEMNWSPAPHSWIGVGPLNTNAIAGSGSPITTFVEPDGTVRLYRIGVQHE